MRIASHIKHFQDRLSLWQFSNWLGRHADTVPSDLRLEGKLYYFSNGGRISIGEGCLFRSRVNSNKMGLNHPCIISMMRFNAILMNW